MMTRLLDIMLPKGGYAMACVEMYFDESIAKSDNLYCVAGYLFKKENCQRLETEWGQVLSRFGLSAFHMVDCAHHAEEFKKKLTRNQCVEVEILLLEILKKYMEVGFAYSIDLKFSHLCPIDTNLGMKEPSPYAFCAYWVLLCGQWWAKQNNFNGKIAYFFESGNSDQSKLDKIMRGMFSNPRIKADSLHCADGFLDKESSGALQCADILAWQWTKWLKDSRNGRTVMRKDLQSLLERAHYNVHLDEEKLLQHRRALDPSDRKVMHPHLYFSWGL